MRPTLQSFRTKLATATPLEIVKLAYISAVVSGTAILAPALVLLPLKLRDLVLAQHGSPALRIACDILSEIVAFTPFFIGAVTLERTHSQLRNGLNANLWPIVQLQLADDFMSSRNFKTDKAYVVAISMVFAGFALYLSFHRMAMGMTLIIVNLYGMFLSPGETLKSITRLLETDLRPPAPRTNWLASPAPLYSVKWGFRDTQYSSQTLCSIHRSPIAMNGIRPNTSGNTIPNHPALIPLILVQALAVACPKSAIIRPYPRSKF